MNNYSRNKKLNKKGDTRSDIGVLIMLTVTITLTKKTPNRYNCFEGMGKVRLEEVE